jgi:hypothetical protein
VKKVLELLLCILHPIAVVLIWINLVLRRDLGLIAKLTWAIAAIVPFVPRLRPHRQRLHLTFRPRSAASRLPGTTDADAKRLRNRYD